MSPTNKGEEQQNRALKGGGRKALMKKGRHYQEHGKWTISYSKGEQAKRKMRVRNNRKKKRKTPVTGKEKVGTNLKRQLRPAGEGLKFCKRLPEKTHWGKQAQIGNDNELQEFIPTARF